MRRISRSTYANWALSAAIFVLSAEVCFRVFWFGPARPPASGIQVEPGGKLFQLHPSLGYSQLPGKFKVTLPDGYSFKLTRNEEGYRVTRPVEHEKAFHGKPEIWIFGCSMTHGWSVDDEDTYAWRLQAALPQYSVRNFGVDGYGTLSSLIQFRDALKTLAPPRIAILAYIGGHDERNTFSRTRRRQVGNGNKLGPSFVQPYARLVDGKLEVQLHKTEYEGFPLNGISAFAFYLETLYEVWDSRRLHSKDVTNHLVQEFAQTARSAGSRFLLGGLDTTPRTRQLLAEMKGQGIDTLEISVDYTDEKHMNLPHDAHPSPLAHGLHAQKLEAALRKRDALLARY